MDALPEPIFAIASGAADTTGLSLPAPSRAGAPSLGGNPMRLLADVMPLADAVMVLSASALAYLLRYRSGAVPLEMSSVTLLAAILCLNLLRAAGAYRQQLTAGVATQIATATRVWCGISLGLVLLGYATKSSDSYSRSWALAWFVIALVGLAGLRVAAAWLVLTWRRSGRLARTMAVVDLSGTGPALARRLAACGAQDVRLLGVYDARPTRGSADIDALLALSRTTRIDEVMLTTTGQQDAAINAMVRRLGTLPTQLHLCPELPSVAIAPRAMALLFGVPVLTVRQQPLAGWRAVAKRLEDIVLGSLILLLVAPVLAVAAVAVRLDSPGPMLFRQRRHGFNNNEFTVYKFRTMRHNRPDEPDEPDVPQARRNDPRVTRVGKFLRRTSLDELPQIFNVLRGDMSLVGPRPHALAHNAKYAALIDDYLGRHRMAPGITGWAQVNGLRGETDTLEKMQNRVESDLAYIDNWSVLLDLKILLQTVVLVVFDRNAF